MNIEHEIIVFYDSNIEIHEIFKNQLNFQTLYIKFRILKQENEILKQKNTRFRIRRNEYRQKSHQLKKKIIIFVYNLINVKTCTIRMQNKFENQTFYVLIFIFSIVQQLLHRFSLFLYFRFQNVFCCFTLIRHRIRITSNIRTSIIFTTIKKSENNEKKKLVDKDLNLFYAIFYRIT